MHFSTIKTNCNIDSTICHILVAWLRDHGIAKASLGYQYNKIIIRTDSRIKFDYISLNRGGREIEFEIIERETIDENSLNLKDKKIQIESLISYKHTPKNKFFRDSKHIVKNNQFIANEDQSVEKVIDNFKKYLNYSMGITDIQNLEVWETPSQLLKNSPEKIVYSKGSFILSFTSTIENKEIFLEACLNGIGLHKSYGYGYINWREI